MVNGGRIDMQMDAIAWAKECERRGAGEILLTSMDTDGCKQGFDLELTDAISKVVNIPVIASGGCGKLEHFSQVFEKTGADAALAASLFHFKELTVVQEESTGEVLMLAYMNEESLRKTMETGYTWFYSRSRQELWNKGATSGHIQRVIELRADCDNDTLLVIVEQIGAACHTGNHSCFYTTIWEEK